LGTLLDGLETQQYRRFETLIVDGNGRNSPARDVVNKFLGRSLAQPSVRLIESPRGLTRQRNVGLREASGDLICFLDDDVSIKPDFLVRVVRLLEQPEAVDVGGLTGYDPLNYSAPVTFRWRLKKLLGTIPSLEPGDADHLGRAVTVSFLKPWSGCREIGWLPGFCMVYRREAIGSLEFDEKLPTYGGEDRDFSMRVGENWRLWICGDLLVRHHGEPQGRDSHLQRIFQTGFGTGRRFAKNAHTLRDQLTMVRTFVGDFLVDVVAFLSRPSRVDLLTIPVRIQGFSAGWSSYGRVGTRTMPPQRKRPVEADTQRVASVK
jgi:glycosyltransferase involved in cell wall biosynthesis